MVLSKDIFDIVENRVIVKVPFIKLYVPQIYLDQEAAVMEERDLNILGIFYFDVYGLNSKKFDEDDPYRYPKRMFLSIPAFLRMSPSDIIEERDEEGNKVYIHIFSCGDTFIDSLNVKQDWKVVSVLFHMLLDGFIPKSVPYDKMSKLISDACILNKMDLKIADCITDTLIAELNRDPTDIKRAFRFAINDNHKISMYDSRRIKVQLLGQLQNNFAALSSGYVKQGITTSINRQRNHEKEVDSSIEETIMDV